VLRPDLRGGDLGLDMRAVQEAAYSVEWAGHSTELDGDLGVHTDSITARRSLVYQGRTFRSAAVLLALASVGACADATPPRAEVRAAGGYEVVARELETMIERERDQKGLRAVSIALVDGGEVVWARGFGEQTEGVPATAQTVYRVGSVSKMFTDIAVMQLVERGELDIDAPVQNYVPEFNPTNHTDTPITLRQLMSHRAGIIREPPAGHYFDDTGTDLATTVRSMAGTPQIYEPTTRTKYSNAGIAVVGYALEKTQGRPFADYVKQSVLEPLGMSRSAFGPEPALVEDLADAYMWGFDRDLFRAPTFELGMAPAGSMYSTVLDLSRFMSAVFSGSLGEGGSVLGAEMLESMWVPQFAEGSTSGYGFGFAVDERFGQRWLGHGGAIYGFSTQMSFLPDSGLGVAVVSAVDGTNTVVGRIADAALELMLAAREGRAMPTEPTRGTEPVDPALARELDGWYGEGDSALELDERDGRLYIVPARGGTVMEARTRGDTLIVDDRVSFGIRLLRDGDGLVRVGMNQSRLERRADGGLPEPLPARWQGLVGEYGWDHNVLYILEREGRLNALIEWFFLYPLEEISEDAFAFPDWGLYHGERLIFERNPDGRATSVEAASVRFERRNVGTEAGGTFRIEPVRPVSELRAEALAASPPTESGSFRDPELVEVAGLESGIRLDMRYASTNNFMSSVFYGEERLFLQRPAAEAVARAHRALAGYGYGLLLHDGYRPWYVTKMFWDATPESQKIFVADPARGSRHNRGSAIDLTLYDLRTGEPVEMVGTYDEFSPRSFPNYPGGTSRQRWLRDLLRRTMEAEGFTVYEAEWWHFDHEDWREYAIQNATFDELVRR
jgi:CubicO group peptidase (beta-lactamase class C family)/D-alanyl-D-alanine dipeptidase